MIKPLIFLCVLFLIVWHNIVKLPIQNEGFIYLRPSYDRQYIPQTGKEFMYFLSRFEIQAVILGAILTSFFHTNLHLYLWVELLSMFAIVVIFYFILLKISKSKLFSFLSSLLFSVNFMGNWDMFSENNYSYFLERIALDVPMLLLSFLLLHLFLEQKKRKYLLVSLLLFLIGVGIALLLIVIAASAYFILGIGQGPKTTTSVPAVTEQTTVKPPAPIPTQVPQPTAPPESSSSASFGQIGGSSGTQTATRAGDLMKKISPTPNP